MSALQLARDLDVQPKTAFVLVHKLCEAMKAETGDATLGGDVEMDGAAFDGRIRRANLREGRVDRRLLANRSGGRRIVVALRERGGRTLTRAFLRKAEGVDFARARIAPGAVVLPTRGRIGICWSRPSTCAASPMSTPTAGTASTRTRPRATSHVSGG